MSIDRESGTGVGDGPDDQKEDLYVRPGIEVWPDEGNFADWIAYHMTTIRPVICTMPEFRASPFCGMGYY